MENISVGNVLVVPILIGLLEAFKKIGLNEKYVPIVAIVLGIISGFASNGFDASKSVESVFVGLGLGLSAVGLYSGVKNTVQKR